jgi:hypothetical protein
MNFYLSVGSSIRRARSAWERRGNAERGIRDDRLERFEQTT